MTAVAPRPRIFADVPASGRTARGPRGAAAGRDDGRRGARILVVDDDQAILLALSRFLRLRSYDVDTAASGTVALDLLSRDEYAVMLCDVRMPGMSGLDLVPHALLTDADLAVVMLTAVNDAVTATDAIAHGAADYLTKPVDLDQLELAVERARRKRELRIHQRHVDQLIRDEVAARTAELEREQAALRSLTVSVVEALVKAMEAKDPFLRGRSHRVSDLAAAIAGEMGLSADTVESVRLAGRLMDVGRIGIREEVLSKPGKLTVDEYAHVQEHVRIGMEILAPLRHLGIVLDYISDHHEHYDGSGYPRALAGEAISIGGRVLAAADSYDAITSGRAHRQALSPLETIAYLRAHAGKLLDPFVYEALAAVVRRHRSLPFVTPIQAA